MKLLLLLTVTASLAAQDIDGWIQSTTGRFRLLHNPVVRTYAFAALAGSVCPAYKAAGRELYGETLRDLNSLTPRAFLEPGPHLPVPSLTALYKLVMPAALKCAADLDGMVDADLMRARIDEEKRGANLMLSTALTRIDADPGRAAQMAEGAISAANPGDLDLSTLTLLLSRLRDRAADLAEDVFSASLDSITSAEYPSPALLMSLGKYLFTSPRYLESMDAEELSDTFTAGNSSVVNFAATRRSTNSDDIRAYIDSGLKVLGAFDSPVYDPVAAYAVALQLLPRAREMTPELADRVQQVLDRDLLLAGANTVAQIQSQLAASQYADADGGEAAVLRGRSVDRVLKAVSEARFTEARNFLKDVDDLPARGQVLHIVDFAESARAIEKHDFLWASTLIGSLRPGIKRVLLYAAMEPSVPSRIEGLSAFQLAMRDIRLLPAEQQMFSWAMVAGGLRDADLDSVYLALTQLVTASNDALTNPRRGRFDPGVVRRINSKGTDTATDSPLILYTRRGLSEVVDTGGRRQAFSLRAPDVSALTLSAVIRNMRTADLPRLEAIVLGLKDESQLADGLNAVAEFRLRSKKQ